MAENLLATTMSCTTVPDGNPLVSMAVAMAENVEDPIELIPQDMGSLRRSLRCTFSALSSFVGQKRKQTRVISTFELHAPI